MHKKKTKTLLTPPQKEKSHKTKKTHTPKASKSSIHEASPQKQTISTQISTAMIKPCKKSQPTSKSIKNSHKTTDNRTTARHKHFSLNLKNKKNRTIINHYHQEPQKPKLPNLPSFRQYCIVEGEFVPIEHSEEKRFVNNIFEETACTSSIESSNYYAKYIHHNEDRCIMKKLSEIEGSEDQKKTNKSNLKQIQKCTNTNQIGIQTIERQIANYSILVKAAHQEIGTQYSNRSAINSERQQNNKIVFLKEKRNNDQIIVNEEEKNENIDFFQMMMKLESLKNPNAGIFDNLTKEQKTNFKEIFQSMVARLQSPRSSRSQNCSNEINRLKGMNSEVSKKAFENAQLQQLIFTRQAKQMSEFPMLLHSEHEIDTSLLSILNFFSDFFCYIELHHQDTLVRSINRMYGWAYPDKYRFISRISKNLDHLNPTVFIIEEIKRRETNLVIISDNIFSEFMEEVMEISEEDNLPIEKISLLYHCKSIFDCINELLRFYQPFYQTKGNPFPWSLYIFQCMTFFSIDNESLQTVTCQVQEKLQNQILSNLCGILIEGYHTAPVYTDQQMRRKAKTDLVFRHRTEKQLKLLEDSITQEDENLDMEIQTTYILHKISILVIESLTAEATQQIQMIFFNN